MSDSREQPVDEMLVLAAQDGHRPAMDELVRRWQKRLWRYARRLTGDSEAAWDITQQAWMAIIRGLRRLRHADRFRPWAYRIVRNKAMDHLKRRPREKRLAEGTLADPADTGDRERGEQARSLRALVDRMPPAHRAVLSLYYIDQLPLTEVAEVLDIPAGTVKSRLHAARNELRRRWREQNEGARP